MPPKDFSPFPHGTCTLSVSSVFLGLEDGSPIFKQGFTCLVLLENNRNRKLEDFHLPWLTKFHCYCLLTYIDYLWPKSGLARHYYQNLGWFFSLVIEMFHFTKFLNPKKDGLPIGNLRLLFVFITLAYRIKLRPFYWLPRYPLDALSFKFILSKQGLTLSLDCLFLFPLFPSNKLIKKRDSFTFIRLRWSKILN